MAQSERVAQSEGDRDGCFYAETRSPEKQTWSKRRVSRLGVLRVPNEEQPLGLPAFNGTKSLGFRNPWFEIQMEG